MPEGINGWRRVSGLIPSENEQQITLRLDAGVIAFFRGIGRRYQSRINCGSARRNAHKEPARNVHRKSARKTIGTESK